ncbi:hypothetical protein D3P07_12440 [Paenibacillus sp. 1011MAR3C5]|uniref:hypothetical protein n=1 Tax=Paenibacillus sp. 1011MAR3C5 TaxID=1675787 RepID=UPI000E6D04A3|nr:hypothetical protein [Paenibacillus sp. 1011MAR3C5]RJE88779.1 hypothetical protein D3P07_12440 [Paenibacillus sp. 1011MAR3C5]
MAAKNYTAAQQQHLEIQLEAAQLRHVEAQRKAIGSYENPLVQKLPATLEELRLLVPGYEQLTEQEKAEIDSLLVIQGMINASMNQMIEAQAQYQYTAGVQQWRMQIDALDSQISDSSYRLTISKLEKERITLLVQFYAMQSYYQLVQIQLEKDMAMLDIQAVKTEERDTIKLYQAGRSTQIDVDLAKKLVKDYEQNVKRLTEQYESRLQLFRKELGLDQSDKLVLLSYDQMKLDKLSVESKIELKKQFDHQKAEEAIRHAKAQHEVANMDNPLLADYLKTVMVVETERKTAIDQLLEQKMVILDSEKDQIESQLAEIESELSELKRQQKDYQKLLANGQVTIKQVEEVAYKLKRLEINHKKLQIDDSIWNEKKRIAVLGVLL